MLEITAAQTLFTRITGIGLASAVFTYYLVKLLVKPFIDVKLATNPYRKFAINAATQSAQSNNQRIRQNPRNQWFRSIAASSSAVPTPKSYAERISCPR